MCLFEKLGLKIEKECLFCLILMEWATLFDIAYLVNSVGLKPVKMNDYTRMKQNGFNDVGCFESC